VRGIEPIGIVAGISARGHRELFRECLDMTDLERLFHQLVSNLAATDPARLHRPLPLADIRETIVPYRANRRTLQLETSEDYELVLMRLCAGEGGFARTEPEETRAEFAAEARSQNPDLTLIQRHENAVVILEPEPLAKALAPSVDLAFAPPDQRFQPEPVKDPAPSRRPAASTPQCNHCNGELPMARKVKFCPHCGASQALTHCPACHTPLEAGWKHCVSCGTAVEGG
jgi:double zinc ribbon protein